jgi:hypothetical protein
MTPTQTKAIEELQEYFSKINAIGHDCHDIFATIDRKIDTVNTNRLEAGAMKAAARAQAVEGMSTYLEQVVRPVIMKYVPEAKITLTDDGGLHIVHNSSYFVIKAKHSTPWNGRFSEQYFKGWEKEYCNAKAETADQLPAFNEELINYVMYCSTL